ncbi:MAG: low-specificity L-threonine aldolase [Pseudomonadota bacterium]
MAAADVGDDVYGDDPTVNRLEATLAEMLGKDAAVFMPTGTQSNLAAVLAHCGRGEEVLVGDNYHIMCHEAAGASVLGGIALQPLATTPSGRVTPDTVTHAIKPDDAHCPMTRLLALENTVGGKAVPLAEMRAASDAAKAHGLAVHLDGARFFNAVTALSCAPHALAEIADTISVCLSKGLGCPVGSVLVGPGDIIRRARRNRKLLGGGLRQAGVLAAAGLFALENTVSRLTDDHERASALANALGAMGGGEVTHHTNMVFFTPARCDHHKLHDTLARFGIKAGAQSPTMRLVVHRDIDDIALNAAIAAFEQALDAAQMPS